jgi:dephospho-CoA kinase
VADGGAAGRGGARPRPVVLGLLGGIASGKSEAAGVLAERGAAHLDADRLARAALDAPDVRRALLDRHGRAIAAADSSDDPPTLDRAALARLVFARPDELTHLEALLHPRVRAELERRLASHLAANDVPAVVLDVPLLLESSLLASTCDLLLFVDTPDELRRERAAALRGWSGDELRRREAHQLPLAQKRARADVVFPNGGSPAELAAAIGRWLDRAGGFAGLPRKAASR